MSTTRKPWSREELLIRLNLYEKIPFGKFHSRNPVLIAVAQRMGRTPASVSMKLGNLGSLDARLHERGIKGLSGASALDRAVWEEFHTQRNTLVPESQALLNELMAGTRDAEVVVVPEAGVRVRKVPTGASTTTREVAVRLGQDYFRDVVLNHYGRRCAVTGLGIEPLLIASHIVPWSVREDSRYDERNGIALNALHDRAFDRGLITFDTELRLVCAPSLHDHFADATVAQQFKAYVGKPLTIPAEAAGPMPEYLEWHRAEVFGR